MTEHIIFLTYIFIFIFSTIGHGEIFSRLINKDLLEKNIGYQGLIGFFSISIKTPCSYYDADIKVKKFLGLRVVYRNDW